MCTFRKTITPTHQQDDCIKARIVNDDYTTECEYFRHSVRREQAKFRALKAAIEEGIESGRSTRIIDDVWAEAETRCLKIR